MFSYVPKFREQNKIQNINAMRTRMISVYFEGPFRRGVQGLVARRAGGREDVQLCRRAVVGERVQRVRDAGSAARECARLHRGRQH